MSSEGVHYFHLTLQKMQMQYVWYPGFDIIAAAIAKDARTAEEEPANQLQENNNDSHETIWEKKSSANTQYSDRY